METGCVEGSKPRVDTAVRTCIRIIWAVVKENLGVGRKKETPPEWLGPGGIPRVARNDSFEERREREKKETAPEWLAPGEVPRVARNDG